MGTLSDEIAALRATVIKGRRHRQIQFAPRTRFLAPGGAKVQSGAASFAPVASIRAVMPLAPSHDEPHKREKFDDGESTVDDGHSVSSRESEAIPTNALPVLQDRHITVRFLWTQ